MLSNLKSVTKGYSDHIDESLKDVKRIFGETPPDIFVLIGSCGKDLIKILEASDPNPKRLNCWNAKHNQNIVDSPNVQSLKNYLPQPIKEEHYGTLHLFSILGKTIMVQEGRAHVYENQDIGSLTLMVRMMARWGTEIFMTTSRSHSISELSEANSDDSNEESGIAIISDHSNKTNDSPFTGIMLGGDDGIGKFRANEINMADVYDAELYQRLLEKFKIFDLTKKVYVFIKDISFSTPTELAGLNEPNGVVGVSLVPETSAAYQAGMKVIAFTEYAKHRSKKLPPHPHFTNVLVGAIEHVINIKIKPQSKKEEEKVATA